MKAKLKGANGFVRFLLNHGEKIGIAAIVVVAGLLIYKSLGREKLGADKQPEKLKTLATTAEGKVRDATWEGIPDDQRTDAAKFQARPKEVAITPVPREKFPPASGWDPSVVPPVKPRTDPQLLAPEKLEVHAQSGLWMSADKEVIREKMKKAYEKMEEERLKQEKEQQKAQEEAEKNGPGGRRGFGGPEGGMRGSSAGMYGQMGGMGGEKTKDGAIVAQPRSGAQMQGFEDIRNVSWVTVLAKVPIKQQVRMYEDALLESRGFNQQNDSPQYFGYIVERSEVGEKGAEPWQRIAAVKDSTLLEEMSQWPIQTPDLVKPNSIHPLLTHPLPPMIVRQWGDEITHSEMPLPTPEELARGFVEELPVEEKKKEETTPDNPFGSALKRTPQNQMYGPEGGMRGMAGPMGPSRGMGMGMGMGYPRGGPEGAGGGMMRGMMGGMSRGGMGMGGPEGGMGPGMMGGMGGLSVQSELQPYVWDGKSDFVLFRYFDSKVEPGHRYKYRVKLVLVDVNALQPEKNLDKEVADRLAKEKLASRDKPPMPKGWRATGFSEESPVAVVPQPGLSFVSTVKSSSNPLAEPEAKMVIKSLDAANAAEIALADYFVRGSVLNLTRHAQVIWSSLFKATDNTGQPVESPTFEFLTGLTLLDFEGGDAPVPRVRTLTAPARALMMDSAGRMTIHEELKDEKSIREFEYIMDAAKKQAILERQQKNEEKRGGGRGRGG